MKKAKTVCRWLLIALCLGEVAACSLFSVTGIVGLCIAVLALPLAPVRALWKRILPPDAPRFAKEAILAAATLVMLAAVPAPISEGQATQAVPQPLRDGRCCTCTHGRSSSHGVAGHFTGAGTNRDARTHRSARGDSHPDTDPGRGWENRCSTGIWIAAGGYRVCGGQRQRQ